MTDSEKIAQIKAVLENSSEQTDTHLLNVIKHIVYELDN